MFKMMFLAIIILGSFLLSYRLSDLMPFIGDQGWFYLSARDLVIHHNFPLVGIASSHPWLHQGPMWTYMLAVILPLFHFDPLSGGYLAVFIGICTLLLLYKVAEKMFSRKVALVATLLYATSPLVIMSARMPYHTTPIPFFTLLFFYSVWKIINREAKWFSVTLFSLAMLYNFELATLSFCFVLLLIIIYGLWKKQKWIKELKNKNILIISLFSFLIPMLPIFIYDTQNGFPQTFKFAAWIGYKILVLFGYPPIHADISSPSWSSVFAFTMEYYKRLIFIESPIVSFAALMIFYYFYKNIIIQIRQRTSTSSMLLLALVFTISVLSYFTARTPSEAYLPMLFPTVIIIAALVITQFMTSHLKNIFGIVVLSLIVIGNVSSLLSSNYFVGKEGGRYSYTDRLNISRKIIADANGQKYNLLGKGDGSEFESFTMNYQYLTWLLGNEPKKEKQKLQFTIVEEKNKIGVIEKR